MVTKKTVFKWQEPFWAAMKATFDAHYKEKYLAEFLVSMRHAYRNSFDARGGRRYRWFVLRRAGVSSEVSEAWFARSFGHGVTAGRAQIAA